MTTAVKMPGARSLASGVLEYAQVSEQGRVRRAALMAAVPGLREIVAEVEKTPAVITTLRVDVACEVVELVGGSRRVRDGVRAVEKRTAVLVAVEQKEGMGRGRDRRGLGAKIPQGYESWVLEDILCDVEEYNPEGVVQWMAGAPEPDKLAKKLLRAGVVVEPLLDAVARAVIEGRLPGLEGFTKAPTHNSCLACCAIPSWRGPVTRSFLKASQVHGRARHSQVKKTDLDDWLMDGHRTFTPDAVAFAKRSADTKLLALVMVRGLVDEAAVSRVVMGLTAGQVGKLIVEATSLVADYELPSGRLVPIWAALARRLGKADRAKARALETWLDSGGGSDLLAEVKLPYRTMKQLLLHLPYRRVATWGEGEWASKPTLAQVREFVPVFLSRSRFVESLRRDICRAQGRPWVWESLFVKEALPKIDGVLRSLIAKPGYAVGEVLYDRLIQVCGFESKRWEMAFGLANGWEGSLQDFLFAVKALEVKRSG